MPVTKNAAEMTLWSYEVLVYVGSTWQTLGFVKDIDPSGLKPKTKDKMIGNFGDIKIDSLVLGLEGTIKMTLHQAVVTVVQLISPWWTSGPVPLTPSVMQYSRYANAKKWKLHPYHLPVSDVTEDIVLLKAFPTYALAKADGKEFRELAVELEVYPDQTQLASGVPLYGYLGGEPAV